MKMKAMTMAVGTKQSNKKGSGQGSSGDQIKPRIAILDLIYKARRKSTILAFHYYLTGVLIAVSQQQRMSYQQVSYQLQENRSPLLHHLHLHQGFLK